MTKGKIIKTLTELKETVEEFNKIKYQSSDRQKELHRKISELYGSIQDYYTEITGDKNIEVPVAGSQLKSKYKNYLEAGYLSGRSFHSHQGYLELISVQAKIKTKLPLNNKNNTVERWTKNTLIGALALLLTLLSGSFFLGKYFGENRFDKMMIDLNDENKILKTETLQLSIKLKNAKDSLNNFKLKLYDLEEKRFQNQLMKK